MEEFLEKLLEKLAPALSTYSAKDVVALKHVLGADFFCLSLLIYRMIVFSFLTCFFLSLDCHLLICRPFNERLCEHLSILRVSLSERFPRDGVTRFQGVTSQSLLVPRQPIALGC